jgi:hypothetical protein
VVDLVHLERFRNVRDPRLGRHVQHDDRSRRYAYHGEQAPLRSIQHERHVPIFDQGSLGSCTGNAAVGCIATGLFYDTITDLDVPEIRTLDEAAAVYVYGAATSVDPFPGTYPPQDTGSDGLSVAKVLQRVGAISGYEHAFGIDQALAALMTVPLIVGTTWLSGMYEPDAEGIVHPTGTVEGGHEYVMDSYNADRHLIGFTNSWGPYWGQRGRFFMEAHEFGNLLADNGDATVFTPATEPAPTPDVPAVPPGATYDDLVLSDEVWAWANRNGLCARSIRKALRVWLTAKGLQ